MSPVSLKPCVKQRLIPSVTSAPGGDCVVQHTHSPTSQRLQGRLAELGIRYIHRKDLAPTKTVRDKQVKTDKAAKTAKRMRTVLDKAFITAYYTECLAEFDPHGLLNNLEANAQVVALFCVEKDPEACHRSLVADRLATEFKLELEHIVP